MRPIGHSSRPTISSALKRSWNAIWWVQTRIKALVFFIIARFNSLVLRSFRLEYEGEIDSE